MVGKYVQLQDAYLSVAEALKHSGIHHGTNVRLHWVDAEGPDAPRRPSGSSSDADGILVPGGFGGRGIEGKILAARVARERGIPYLGSLPRDAGRGRSSSPVTCAGSTGRTRASSIPRRPTR